MNPRTAIGAAAAGRRTGWLAWLAVLLGAVVLGACAAHSDAVAQGAHTDRIIVHFAAEVSDASGSQFVNLLSQDAGAQLTYLRPLAGGAHLYRVEGDYDRAQLQELCARLTARPDILLAEIDRTLRPQ